MSEYEKYQLQWMIEHGHSLSDLIENLDEMGELYEEEGYRGSAREWFDEWEFNRGFSGELWACEEEWEAKQV